jgi:CHAT domain-containing protein
MATASVVKRELATVQIFHFAGHALSTAGDVALVLAPNTADNLPSDTLGTEDLEASYLQKLRLVVLSACGTQNSPGELSADPSNLAFVFLRAGVPHVIATRWDVDSASARLLMDYFYDQLLLGASVPEALRTASMKLRKEAGRDHPYYWAAFESFGRS